MLTGFPRTRWLRQRFSESYAVRISVKISRICELRVIMGIMTSLLGCCLSSSLGSRANDYVKTLATLWFWLHHLPCSLRCWTNNTLAARSASGNVQCRCRENILSETIDIGDARNWPLFPIMSLRLGDIGRLVEYVYFRIGPLICKQGKWIKYILNIKTSGAYQFQDAVLPVKEFLL